MILRYEDASVLECVQERSVLPLEFIALEAPNEVTEVLATASVGDADVGWKARVEALEAKLAAATETARLDVETARRNAELQTREELSSEMKQQTVEKRAEVAKLIEQFGRERAQYFADVEGEVVSLALAIAGRVLHREAMLDPMLLRAVVQVALVKVEGESAVTLRVPEGQVEEWCELFGPGRRGAAVTVVADEQLAVGDAVLETRVGRVELGVREQLKEIERGFFDLVEKRPS